MVQLSEHFALEEFQKNDAIPSECIPAFTELCQMILEPVRKKVGIPIRITSGYRSVEANTEAHGQANSEHVATADYCAADFYVGAGARMIFDWMRTNPSLPYHQLILESGANSTIIHVSWNRLKPGVRSVLVGATHNAQPYQKADYVAYNPPQPADLSSQGDA
jgi:zinc D-Ala-D-Ala carboxypeptidase